MRKISALALVLALVCLVPVCYGQDSGVRLVRIPIFQGTGPLSSLLGGCKEAGGSPPSAPASRHHSLLEEAFGAGRGGTVTVRALPVGPAGPVNIASLLDGLLGEEKQGESASPVAGGEVDQEESDPFPRLPSIFSRFGGPLAGMRGMPMAAGSSMTRISMGSDGKVVTDTTTTDEKGHQTTTHTEESESGEKAVDNAMRAFAQLVNPAGELPSIAGSIENLFDDEEGKAHPVAKPAAQSEDEDEEDEEDDGDAEEGDVGNDDVDEDEDEDEDADEEGDDDEEAADDGDDEGVDGDEDEDADDEAEEGDAGEDADEDDDEDAPSPLSPDTPEEASPKAAAPKKPASPEEKIEAEVATNKAEEAAVKAKEAVTLEHIKAEEGKVAASAAEAESRAEGLQASLGRLAAMQGKLQQSLVA